MPPLAATPRHSLLDGLIANVTAAYEAHPREAEKAEAIATALQPFLGEPDLLTAAQSEPDPTRYRQELLHVDRRGRFSIVALVWMKGQETGIHDHVSWCAIGVHQGCEHEVSYRLLESSDGSFLVPEGNGLLGVGEVAALTPPGDIHRVVNPGPGTAISIHVYGLDVSERGTSIRRRYDLPVLEQAPAGSWPSRQPELPPAKTLAEA